MLLMFMTQSSQGRRATMGCSDEELSKYHAAHAGVEQSLLANFVRQISPNSETLTPLRSSNK
jgi:hypothetical protein